MANKPDTTLIRTLKTETGKLLEEGIIKPEQKDLILGRYEAMMAAEDAAGPVWLITTISVLGTLLAGIGVLLLVAMNWSRIPDAGKLAIIFTSLFATYGAGFYLRYERRTLLRASEGLILLGSLIFGAGIFLIARMYHISVDYPEGPLLWGLAVLPLAYLLGLNALLSLVVIDLLVWVGMEANYAVYFTHGSMAVFASLFLLAGITLWTVGLMHRGFPALSHLAGPYITIGLVLTLASGYAMTFEFMQWYFGAYALTPFYYGFALVSFAALAVSIVKGEKKKAWLGETIFLAALFLIVLILCLTSRDFLEPSRISDAHEYTPRGRYFNLLRLGFNLLYAIQVIGVLVLGYLRRNRVYLNVGLIFFALEVIAPYFDVFWRPMPRSLFFICGGVLLTVGGIALEKKRRKVLSSFKTETD